jgi:hypothetical protein
VQDEAGHICIEVETRVVVVGGALGEVRVRPVLGLHAIHDTLGTMQREQWWRDITVSPLTHHVIVRVGCLSVISGNH